MTGAIFGIFGPGGSRERVDAMAARLTHRGGKMRVEQVANSGWIGVLAENPGSHLHQSDQQGLVYQGRIYNSGCHGHALRGYENAAVAHSQAACGRGTQDEHTPARCLSEIIHANDEIEAIDGDFALAHIDAEARTLTLARDYFGCAPLYYAVLPGGGVAFASEYKALLAVHSVPAEPDYSMVQHLQHAKRLPIGRTLLANVQAVPPGCVLRFNKRGECAFKHRFAPLKVDAQVRDTDAACALIRGTLETATRRRSADLDRIGLALSGGIDSIALAFLFRRLYPDKPIVTFTAGSHERDHEIVTARKVASAIGSEHHEIITPASMLADRLPRLVWHLEDPYSRSETLQLFEIGRAAAHAGVKVLFGAQGADGLFAGMPKYKLLDLMRRFPMLRAPLSEFYTYTQLGIPPRSALARLGAWAKFRGSVPPVPRVLGELDAPGPFDAPAPIDLPEPGDQFINRTLARGFQSGVCQDIQKFERGFAAFGVAYRSPFYDLALVRAAFTIDDRLKIRAGQQKWVFRKALEPWVPAEFRSIPKFPQRMEANMEFAAALDALTDRILDPETVQRHGLFEPRSIRRLRRPTPAKPYSHEGGMRLWTAILTELWRRAFVDRRGEPADKEGKETAGARGA